MHFHAFLKGSFALLLGAAALRPGTARPAAPAFPSSHREAPFITEHPKVDATDFYLFRSYEAGREGFVTVIANYQPIQAPYGGPNYFFMDSEALYEIHLDNDGDAREDLTFQFRFTNDFQEIALDIGPDGATESVPVPLLQVAPVTPGDDSGLNLKESYTLTVVSGPRRGNGQPVTNATDASSVFTKPVDNIGTKTIPDYDAYAAQFVYDVDIPGVGEGRVFVGQRKDPFVVNLGETFDLINTDPLGPPDGEPDLLADANVTSLVLELPIAGILSEATAVVGGWTTASLRQGRVLNPRPSGHGKGSVEGGAYTQVSRLSAPLVNELVIGLPDKDRFNASEPKDDAQFLTYVTNPTLPALIETLFPVVTAPTLFPRNDLVQAFLTGVTGLNQNGATAEMIRLNTTTAPVAQGLQDPLGVIGGDGAGFPNGRRPGDDVVDIALRVVMGVLLDVTDAPSGQLPFTDGAFVDDSFFDATFPYLRTPLAGSPNQ